MKKKLIKHLKSDIKTFKHEANEDRELIKDINKKRWTSADEGAGMPYAFNRKKRVKKSVTPKRSKGAPKKIGKIGIITLKKR